MYEKCDRSVWKVHGKCVERVWKVCGKCLGSAREMSGEGVSEVVGSAGSSANTCKTSRKDVLRSCVCNMRRVRIELTTLGL